MTFMPLSFESSNNRCKLWTEFIRICSVSTTHISYLLTWRRSTLRPGCTLFACLPQEAHVQTSPNFIRMLSMIITQS